MPHPEALQILSKYLPTVLYYKLNKFLTGDCKHLRCSIDWNYFESKLKTLSLEPCSQELIKLLSNNPPNENSVKIFHISNNEQVTKSTEPTLEKTSQMIYNFLTYIYQRNILVSLIKYILLKEFLYKFTSSKLIETQKGLFSLIYKRLNEIIFEFVLTAFNGSNYDNYLIINSLLLILTKLGEKIKIFKKGSSISTIFVKIKKNLNQLNNITDSGKCSSNGSNLIKKNSKIKNTWPLNLYIKDIRNLVAANMSLDKIGKLYMLNVSKLCFPYEKATSISQLKKISSLHPRDENFWKDSFFNKNVPLEIRLEAQNLFEQKKFKNLYEYSIYYLTQDCLLLHTIVMTLFRAYLLDNINIFFRRNFSQSNLSYQQFFIIEPSKQIIYNNAPKIINNTFFNYLIKQAVTGGLCTSFVHGNINKETIINEHFNYLEYPSLNKFNWPNFNNCKSSWLKSFKETPTGIATIDIRSLYPSAALKKLPVNYPLFYSRFIFDDFTKIKDKTLITLNLKEFCKNSQLHGNFHSDRFKLLNKAPRFHCEYYAIQEYLRKLPKDIIIIRFQSNFTALGQLYVCDYPVDAFLSYRHPKSNIIHLKVIQYNSVLFHGHQKTCKIKNDPIDEIKTTKSLEIKNKISYLLNHMIIQFDLKCIEFEYVELSDCHFFLHQIPRDTTYLFSYKNYYKYNNFLQSIYQKELTGFLVVKNLEIKKDNQNPIFGFIIQKVEYELKYLSDYTQRQLKNYRLSKRVISLNKSKSFMVISTEYFLWLYKTFGFETTPDIYHALLFQTDYYLRSSIENKLILRKQLKELIKTEKNTETKQKYEIKSELIKLMLNSCYGFTLCNLTSAKYKCFENRKTFPHYLKKRNKINSCIQINQSTYLVETKKIFDHPFQSLLGHVGCYILFHSKIILLKRLYFLLKYLNPKKAQLLYMDTDSAHFLVKHRTFEENVDTDLKKSFKNLFDKHFETGNKTSGIWVQEGFFEMGEYIGEKSYKLCNTENNIVLTHMKGLNQYFQNEYVKQNIDIKKNPYIAYNMFTKSPDFILFKSHMSKDLFSNYVPIKRYFVYAAGSLPLKLE